MTLPAERSVLVVGEPGHGKTAVALHRLAHLWRSSATPPSIRTRANARRADLQHLFGDGELLARAISTSKQKITEQMLADVIEHNLIQFEKTTEEAFSHVTDRERLVAVDRRALDEGTASGDAKSVDVEDCRAPRVTPFDDEFALAAWLIDELRSFARGDRGATVAVVCRSSLTARRFARWLRIEMPARLVFDGRFWARGGHSRAPRARSRPRRRAEPLLPAHI